MFKPNARKRFFVWLLPICSVFTALSATIPTNIREGFLPPLRSGFEVSKNFLFSINSQIPLSGPLLLERTTDPRSSRWNALTNAPQQGNFLLNASSASSFYRLKSLNLADSLCTLAIQIQHSTNTILAFPFLREWDHSLQRQNPASGKWEMDPSLILTNGFVTVPGEATPGLRIVAKPPLNRESFEAIFVGGQSNAEIADNQYHPNKDANVMYLDSELGFRHPARFYDALKNHPWSYSFAIGGAGALSQHTGRKYLVVGVAVGATQMSMWMPGEDRFDPSTLFGRANLRRIAAAPQGIRAIWYYGHESSTSYPSSPHYIPEWKKLIGEFQKELGPVPVIFAQLAKSTNLTEQLNMFTGAEQQRLSEQGQSHGSPGHHMVVTFDLPLGDNVHLNGEANRILGLRFARAMRQHVYGEAVDGTGPRLVSVSQLPENVLLIRLTFTQVITQPVNAYDKQFRVTDDNGAITIIGYTLTADGRSIDLRLRSRPAGTLRVSYGAPPAAGTMIYLTNVVRNLEGLPAPAFGPIAVPWGTQ